VYSYFVVNLQNSFSKNSLLSLFRNIVPANLPWVSIYWICGLIAILMVIFVIFLRFPKVELVEDEKIEGFSTVISLFKDRTVLMFFLGMFAYVGTEQGISIWISKFLSTYHGFNPHTVGAHNVAMFWGAMTIGGLLGLILLKLIDIQVVLGVFIVCAMVCLGFGLFGSADVSLIAFPACGFFLSVMYPGVYSLGLNSVSKHHGSVAGILCTAIMVEL
jgi:MFS transporter, FHS family, L-fucose permease